MADGHLQDCWATGQVDAKLQGHRNHLRAFGSPNCRAHSSGVTNRSLVPHDTAMWSSQKPWKEGQIRKGHGKTREDMCGQQEDTGGWTRSCRRSREGRVLLAENGLGELSLVPPASHP